MRRITVRHASFGAIAAVLMAMSQALSAQDGQPPPAVPPSTAPQTPAPAPATPPDVFTIGSGRVAPPRALSDVKPGYTPEAIRARIEGVVRLRGIVERDGTVSGIEVIKSLDATYGLDQAAIDAFKQWRFQPGTIDGNPVRVLINMEMTFTLRGANAVQAWPDGFTAGGVPTGAVDETAETQGLRVKMPRPVGWITHRDLPGELFRVRSGDGLRFVAVLQPTGAPVELRSPAAPAIIQQIAESVRRSVPGGDSEVLATGQIQTPLTFYVWSALRLPTVPNPAGAAAAPSPYSEARTWMFTRTINGKAVGIACTVLIPRGVDAAAIDARVRQAAAEFAPILSNISIEVLPG
jgi:TonB family protein